MTSEKSSDELEFEAKVNAVQLTQERIDAAIYQAKLDQYFIDEKNRKIKAEIDRKTENARMFTKEEMYKVAIREAHRLVDIKRPGHRYILDEFSKPIFKMLCLYFTNDPEFETMGEGFSLGKGLCLSGPVGVGKTDTLKAFHKNKKNCFHTVAAGDISTLLETHGTDYYQAYVGYVPNYGGPSYYDQLNLGWMIDELGTERTVVDYGNRMDPIYTILMKRYDMAPRIPFNTMHLTTNFTPSQLEEHYDGRLRSRFRQMFNWIKMDGGDRRGL